MLLNYPPFAACQAMAAAARNAPPLRRGCKGLAVSLLQAALLRVGEKLPQSINTSGHPDGTFGPETERAMMSYQAKRKLRQDGVAGGRTIKALEDDMAKLSPALPPSLPPLPVLPSTPHYEVGTGDPPLGHDPGAGPWKSRPIAASYLALKLAILEALPVAYVAVGDDATKHMAHYLDNSGSPYTIDLEGMVNDVPSAKKRYEDEVSQAQELVERLPIGKHVIHSRVAEGGYNWQAENRNWFFAIGGYTKWGEGTATIKSAQGSLEYELDFTYKFYDRYNWDAGKSVSFAGITVTDTFMGEFHRQGLAREFDCYGSFKRRLIWKKGGSIPASQLYASGGR